MLPKLWKALFLAPIAVTMITGCGDRKHKDEPTSKYAGNWLQKEAYKDLDVAVHSGRNPDEVDSILCRRALEPNRRAYHGLSADNRWNGTIQFLAYFVT